ncbi:MAG: hypothetical protein JOZ69_22385, partial [Myxococcales bacterium]|nr:hypothetical protein [Myxococcales bacterium]
MAYPNDPTQAGAAAASAFQNARITPEEAERLAASFRPSWELDELSFHASGAPAAVGAGAGAGAEEAHAPKPPPSTSADVRSVVQALNGTHAPAPSLILHEPSVIIEPGLANDTAPRRMPAALAAAPAADASSAFGPLRARSMTGVWAGIAVTVLAVAGLGVWAVSGSADRPATPAAPALEPPHATAAESKIPPPPPASPAPPAATHASAPAA